MQYLCYAAVETNDVLQWRLVADTHEKQDAMIALHNHSKCLRVALCQYNLEAGSDNGDNWYHLDLGTSYSLFCLLPLQDAMEVLP